MTDTPIPPLSRRRQQVLDDALAQLRQTRDQLDPTLLARIRALIGDRTLFDLMPAMSDDRAPLPQGVKPWNPAAPAHSDTRKVEQRDDVDFEPIDRRQNLQTIRLFLEMHTGNKTMQSKVRTLMADYFG